MQQDVCACVSMYVCVCVNIRTSDQIKCGKVQVFNEIRSIAMEKKGMYCALCLVSGTNIQCQ